LLASPAFGLAVASGIVGVGSAPGVVLAAAAILYLAVALFALQPRLERRMLRTTGPSAAAQEFLEQALALRDVDEVAKAFGAAVVEAVGPTRVVLLAPAPEGGVRVIDAVDTALPEIELGDPTAAFLWLGDREEPLRRTELLGLQEFDGAKAALSLMDAVGCDLILPLLHRGLLLGLGMVRQPSETGAEDLAGFYRAMRAYTTVAIANTFLDAEARDRSALTRTFDLATAIQESLMPDERPVRREGFELRGLFRPVAECGGDVWAWRELADGKVLVLVADATGHGAAPALLAAVAKGTIDARWQMQLRDLDPGELLAALNTSIHRTGRKRYLMTAFAAVVDTRAGKLYFANAGQNFPYFIHGAHGDRRVEPLIARGNSLGVASVARYETYTREMTHGDKLVLYTDGVTDAGSPMTEPWGDKRFRAALTAMAKERAVRLPDLVMAEIEEWLAGRQFMDDITMVAFQYGTETEEEEP